MRLWAALLGLVALAAILLGLDRALPPDLSRLATVGATVLDRNGRLLAVTPAAGGVWRLATGVDDVDPAFIDRLVATEDRQFWHHPGVNPLALVRAAFQDLRAGHIVSGGSTLTMQVARLLHPRPRTVRAKLIEIARALQLEWRFSKRDILGMWLTLAPYGGNLEGVRAGSMAWFGVPARALDDAQIALLVAIPRHPETLRPDRHAARAQAVRDRILHAPGPPVPTRRLAMPRHGMLALGCCQPPPGRTTLDLALQSAVERISAEAVRTLPAHGSTALLIADAASGDILAVASGAGGGGSGDALDLSRAVRSPGSALKPFIYAMAFDAGLAGPDTLLQDVPRRFGAYAPENYDRDFNGPVRMAEALRRSLNLPAVGLLNAVGPAGFLARMRTTGLALRLPATATGTADPSLPLALGGVGISVRDLAGFYTALATDGAVRRLHLQGDAAAPVPLVSPRAARTIAGILTQDFPDGGPVGVAWKTGTSWGGRDAWAVGFDARHVAVAWVGRPDGTPLAAAEAVATGRSLALPLLARLFTLLPASPLPPPPPPGRPDPSRLKQASADALRLLFPPPDATISADGPITLRAMGGRRPLLFLVDGAALPSDPARRETSWRPGGPGFYRLTILDADGHAAHAPVRIRTR
jgi:penicillin-binding protein 1C